ncbi:MAG TPA: hypothetical protein VNK46_02440 [Nitrospiraceae bacterium]|jgi:hypothetical protein|nr:hypothetical protein [Nitrospiraceae bacterium]
MHGKSAQRSVPIPGATGVFALVLIALYVVLSVAAVSCPPDAGPQAGQAHPHQHGHHNQNGLTHSPLCAWACQADLSASLMPSRAGLPILLLLIGFLLPTSWLPPLADLRSGCSRSPPLSRLSR